MTWFKVDDSFYDHPKVFDAPDCAVALWTRAGTWSARNLTNGFVPAGMPARLCDDPDTAVRELVRRGLWKRTSGGYQFHDWSVYQPTAEDVILLRQKRAAAGRRGGQAKAANAQARPDTTRQTASKPLASASPVAKQNAAPTRPVPKGRGTGDLSGGTAVTRASPEPPPRCPQHLDHPDPPPCGPCADARRTRERHDRDQAAQAAIAQQARAHDRAAAARAAIDACQLCDHHGYTAGKVCHHDPNTHNRTRRGAALAAAAIQRPPDPEPTHA